MRIVYIDLHDTSFLCLTKGFIESRYKIHSYKHKFIIDGAMESGIQICDYITRLNPGRRRDMLFRKLFPAYDFKVAKYVFKNNDFKNNICLITDISEIQENDIVIAYFHEKYQRNLLPKLPGHKILMGNHFIRIDTPISFEGTKIEAFVNEIDLTDNEFIKRYFTMGDTKHILCPYAFEDRFKSKRNYQERINKLLAIGTASTVDGSTGYDLYKEYAGTPWVQPMRKEIWDNAEKYPDYIASHISYIFEDELTINETDNPIVKKFKAFYNKYKKWTQSKYTSFDMVEKFNEYRMFVCPEEFVGMPGIGFVEGMACGCAYIGLDHSMYRCLGLIPGKHYIAYDGTLTDLLSKTQYYQEHEKECEAIAKCGTEYIRKNFNQKKVAAGFIAYLSSLTSGN